jgi:hypothetical protein
MASGRMSRSSKKDVVDEALLCDGVKKWLGNFNIQYDSGRRY